ncbi:nickel/cobalt efflux transporter [Rhizobium sp. SG570]|uniref:nickel/cobalt efflux transporter n=1 Tax=Rhizobium sp. SG570 TaxID=2587113 RepID=UPI00144789D9|nr:nickel/cobalt efflux transporter [Rhizobium sp. SG570]
MTSLPALLQQGTAHAWLFIPTAIFLGALHGLEPGHSKTMMAAFIIAVRGTIMQAALLGVSAAISHTAVVWVVALGGQYLGRGMNAETIEPYFQIASAVIVIGIALWMIRRTWRETHLEAAHNHSHDHDHGRGDETRKIDTGHGIMALEVFEDGVPPHFRIRFETGHGWRAKDVAIVTERDGGAKQAFAFVDKGAYLESLEEIPEPHEFSARVSLGHGDHTHDYDVAYSEDGHHHHNHGLSIGEEGEHMDAHARAHANDIARRFKNQSVTTGQIIMFGLTGGLIPCPAAITVLLLCLQLKQLSLGVVLVVCFSIGLAITMVAAGVAASISVRHVQKRWSGFDTFAKRAPYASGVLMLVIALYMGYSGWAGLEKGPAPEAAAVITPAG